MSLWYKILGPLQKIFRTERARTLVERFPDIKGSSIIDIGGSLPFWNLAGPILQPASVRIYNLTEGRTLMNASSEYPGVEISYYDGKNVPEEDLAADFVICNSVFEHVPKAERQFLAEEIIRIGRNYIIQTPSIAFPIDVHFGLPFLHWLPRSVGRHIVKISPFALWGNGDIDGFFEETVLLGKSEFLGYFPGSELLVERVGGFTKSMTLVGKGRPRESS